MRWERLFADLESQQAAEQQRIQEANIAEVTRLLAAETSLEEMCLRLIDTNIKVWVRGMNGPCSILLKTIGQRWLAGIDGNRQFIANFDHLMAIEPVSKQGTREGSGGKIKVPLRSVMRELARQRTAVHIGGSEPNVQISGTIDRVGQDYCEVSEHQIDEYRRNRSVRGVKWVALGQISFIFSKHP